MKKKIIFSCLIMIVTSLSAFDTPDTLWKKVLGGTDQDFPSYVEETNDGCFIIAGYTRSWGLNGSNVWLIKTNTDGDTIWTNTYGGDGNDIGNSAQQTTDGGYIVGGWTNSMGSGFEDYFLIKIDESGNEEWRKAYGGEYLDVGKCIRQTSDGGYIITGNTLSFGQGDYDILVIKTNDQGNIEWYETYGGSLTDYANSIRQTSDGGYIIAGSTSSIGAGSLDFYLVKIDADGNTQWEKTYGGAYSDFSHSVRQTVDGGYIIAGRSQTYGAGDGDFWLVKTDKSGNELWARAFGGTSGDEAECVQLTDDGGYILTGCTYSHGLGDFWTIKTDSEGNEIWSHTFGGDVIDYADFVQPTTDGGYIVVGHTYSFGMGWSDALIVRFGPEPAGTVEGTVINKYTGTPINGAVIVVHSDTVSTTDSYGSYSFGFSQGYYDITCSADGYIDSIAVDVIINPNGTTDLDFELDEICSIGEKPIIPNGIMLGNNYPNPFDGSTTIQLHTKGVSIQNPVKVKIYNISGQLIDTLVSEDADHNGTYIFVWDGTSKGSRCTSGVYFYEVKTNNTAYLKKMILMN